ncbi:unnamed protein product [Enterobius vermicularis]|uniref:C-type lectin domain-containing protein n=1 Tax=Enterobius vermicularis TaxID=51028 RepID=A0A0N4VEP0_ENTVE|nr:unnamed protein product [Enterobius vermicularis]
MTNLSENFKTPNVSETVKKPISLETVKKISKVDVIPKSSKSPKVDTVLKKIRKNEVRLTPEKETLDYSTSTIATDTVRIFFIDLSKCGSDKKFGKKKLMANATFTLVLKVEYCDNCVWGDTNNCKLASIHNEQEDICIGRLVRDTKTNAWLGLRRPKFTWENRAAVNFENWSDGKPNFLGGHCTMIRYDLLWDNYFCTMKNPAICQWKRTPTNGCGNYSNIYSGDHWCYHVTKSRMSWLRASSYCKRRFPNGRLASISTKDEMKHFRKMKQNFSTMFLWIGYNRLKLYWSDHSPVDYQDFNNRQRYVGNFDYCAFMPPSTLGLYGRTLWSQKPCNHTLQARVCQRTKL